MRAAIIGTGLIGGSIGFGLVEHGYEVVGFDRDATRLDRARERGAVTSCATSIHEAATRTDLAVVALPVGAIADAVVELLDADVKLVTDVGSVKGAIVSEVAARAGRHAARFVGGHPMAGSEADGIEGAFADLFAGAAWVLTPTASTGEPEYTAVRALVSELRAEVVTVTPEDHDVLVSFVSHVPQLAASTLMDVASTREVEHRVLLRLAAGGFRDMTRIAASHPTIWLDILTSNRAAVLDALDAYIEGLRHTRDLVARSDRDALSDLLESARAARRNLPVMTEAPADLVELRVPVADRPGVIAEVATLAGRLGVNVHHIESTDTVEGRAGVLLLMVAATDADRYEAELRAIGYHPSRTDLP